MRRVWVTLFAAPLVLALAFAPVLVFFATVRDLDADALLRAVEGVAALPASVAFVALLLLTRFQAKRDGRSMATLGWTWPPRAQEIVVGLGAGGLVAMLDALWFYPLVQRFQPGFDPTLAGTPLWAATAMLLLGVAAEETLYRGYALTRLRQRYGAVVAAVVTSVFYVLLTPGPDVALKVWAFFFGLALAALRMWRGTLWSVALAHVVVSLGPKVVASLGIA
jgi:membrane protease YdiL (CAAX protease family)